MNCWTYNRSKSSVNAGPFKIFGLVCDLRLDQTLTDSNQTLLLPSDSYGFAAVRIGILLDSEIDGSAPNANAN